MKLGILSDTHDRLQRTVLAVAMLRDAGATALVHCGDFTTAEIVTACAVVPCWFVFGNNDADAVVELRHAAGDSGATCLGWGGTFSLANRRLGVAHGHLTTDLRRVLDEQPEVLFYGHSHIARDHVELGVRRINPGALHRASEFTVALLDLESDNLEMLHVPR